MPDADNVCLDVRIDCLVDEIRLLAEVIRAQGETITDLTNELTRVRACLESLLD